ncbi:hypothetical protein K493DRAFT_300105 [Basidiobolus meristosporus CBS 931.73]|uniref:DUF5077 domain-containing protein n=1 Tax=Basidiobolus meristosporus CBS 931.73 TaxID=1314790 RepID=A0A1Y1YJ75_9FUNG|nr:hypothetical protein K493DRAFT_300105 [Basidiobolus meristosporus CBS 931.73]|eukprot:ORX98039.1 hypothetical protein K493DRAFT_300105 [Basidiobolus meristosporus CBS 931.73]
MYNDPDFPNWNVGPVKSFESDLLIPDGMAPPTTYWNPAGFGTGYFGFQTLDTSEDRVLIFSVWNLKNTTTEVIKMGENVWHTSFYEMGGWGTHAFMNYHWQTGVTYRVKIEAEWVGNDTVFTASFRVNDQWHFFASIKGIGFGNYSLDSDTGIYQFLEDFGGTVNQTRKGIYSRQCYRIEGSDFCYPNWGGYISQACCIPCWGAGVIPSGEGTYLAFDGNPLGTEDCNHVVNVWLNYNHCAMDEYSHAINA